MKQSQALQVFNFEQNEIRTIIINGEIWFVAADVCKPLGLNDVSKAVERLDEDEKGTNSIRTLGGNQEMLCVSEPGFYHLTRSSRKPSANRFRRWVDHEVLPAIRKTGKYAAKSQKPVAPKPPVERIGPPPPWTSTSPGMIRSYFVGRGEAGLEEVETMLTDYLTHMNEPLSVKQLQESPAIAAIPLNTVRLALSDLTEFGTLETVKDGKTHCYQLPAYMRPYSKGLILLDDDDD